jgi:hypothetical protein
VIYKFWSISHFLLVILVFLPPFTY